MRVRLRVRLLPLEHRLAPIYLLYISPVSPLYLPLEHRLALDLLELRRLTLQLVSK